MEIKGNIHCLFEQSGTFKNAFIKLGYKAYDYDIQNNFHETDFVVDLFGEIEKAYDSKPSIFDNFTPDDLLMAFFPCIYFCGDNTLYFSGTATKYKALTKEQKIVAIVERDRERDKFYILLLKLFFVAETKQLRLIVENPYSHLHYLYNNFPYKPKVIDYDRTRRGDFFVKPTQFFFCNCEPTFNETFVGTKERKNVRKAKEGFKQGICSEERSMISPEYAHNFICDFVLGKVTKNTQLTLF